MRSIQAKFYPMKLKLKQNKTNVTQAYEEFNIFLLGFSFLINPPYKLRAKS